MGLKVAGERKRKRTDEALEATPRSTDIAVLPTRDYDQMERVWCQRQRLHDSRPVVNKHAGTPTLRRWRWDEVAVLPVGELTNEVILLGVGGCGTKQPWLPSVNQPMKIFSWESFGGGTRKPCLPSANPSMKPVSWDLVAAGPGSRSSRRRTRR